MRLRTKGEQKAYLDGFERCAECVEQYLTVKGKNILEGLLMAVRNAVEIEDVVESDIEESDAEFMCKAMSKTINKFTDDRNFIGGF